MQEWYIIPVATAISWTFNQLTIFYPNLCFPSHACIDFNGKFFVMQARAHSKAPCNFVIKRLFFVCLRLVDQSSLSIHCKKPRSFPCSSDFKDITKFSRCLWKIKNKVKRKIKIST